jgi:dynein heavy chain
LFSYNAQSILLIDQVKWSDGVTEAVLNEEKAPKKGLRLFEAFMKEMITKMVAIVRKDLNILQRTLMGALIVIDVHARDVVSELVEKGVKNLNDFEFSKQLRYYWEVEEDDCFVKQTNTSFRYGYEYLGNGPRLVITPLTDKCYITLTSAKHLQFGGAPAGPAGTGKTETTKDLAKALAVQCVVFNCSDGLDYKTMGRFFSGLAQGGAWSCFDEFNRIDIEVLSVIAQQILTIQQAIKRDDTEF